MDAESLLHREAIVDTLVRLFVSTDRRDWATVERCFAESVLFDVTSLAGGEPSRLAPSQIVAGWADGLARIQAIHHQAGNFQVELDGGQAIASCYAIAMHYRPVASGRNTRSFVGSYDFHLVRDATGTWRIDLFRLNLKFLDGNPQLDSEPAAV